MILITGASGLLGTALKAALSDGTDEVVGLRSRDGDLRDPNVAASLMERYRPEIVYHVAALVHGIMGNKTFPADMFLDNIRINTNVVDAARRSGCGKIVAVSTVAAYPAGLPFPLAEDSIWDGAPHQSEQFYAHAKRAMLAHLTSCKLQYGLEFGYAILTNLYGPGDRFDTEHGHVVPSLIAKFHAASRDGAPLTVWGSGIAKRDFLHADDAARALVAIGRAGTGTYNVASGTTVPIRQVVDILSEISGVADIRWDRSKPDGQLDRSYDVAKLKALGFTPQYSLEDGLTATYGWYSENFPNERQ